MSFVIVLAALAFLMFAAYRGYSVILFAPIAALGAVLLTEPAAVAPVFSGIFMETHPRPEQALSDGPNAWPLELMPELLETLVALDAQVKSRPLAERRIVR